MADTRDKVGRAGVFLAGGVFKTAVYIFIIVFLIWVGKSAYQFGYDVFNQQAMSPGEGQQVTVVIKEGASAYKVGKTLEQKGLIKDALAFTIQGNVFPVLILCASSAIPSGSILPSAGN